MKEPWYLTLIIKHWFLGVRKLYYLCSFFFNKGTVASEMTSGDFCFIGCDAIRILWWNCRGWASFLGGLVAWGVEAFFQVVALGGLSFFLWTSEYGYFRWRCWNCFCWSLQLFVGFEYFSVNYLSDLDILVLFWGWKKNTYLIQFQSN